MTDKDIRNQERSFKRLLELVLGDEELWELLNFVAKYNQVFILVVLSGISSLECLMVYVILMSFFKIPIIWICF